MLHDHFQQVAPPRQRGDVSLPPSLLRGGTLLLAALLGTAADIPASHAAGARESVVAAPGEIVMMRDVSTRHAVRQAPDGMALMVDTGPEEQVQEISDGDYQAISGRPSSLTAQGLGNGLSSAPLPASRASVGMPDPARAVMVSTGAMGGATRAVGEQVLNAVHGAGLLGK